VSVEDRAGDVRYHQLVRLIVVVAAGQLTLASLVLAVMALPLQFLVTRGNRQYPLNISPVAISRLSAGLLFMAGCGLIATAL
jgi:hypothetical protein